MTGGGVPNKWLFLSGQGITSGSTVTLTPPTGTIWKIHWGMISLHTGSTAGTRSLKALLNTPSTYSGAFSGQLVNFTGWQTGTSTSYNALSGNFETYNPSGGSSYNSSTPFIVPPGGTVTVNPTLVSGDSFDYYFIIEQVLTL